MAKNDDRKRKLEQGGKGVSIILAKEAQESLAFLQDVLMRRGEPHSQEATIARALNWAAEQARKGKNPTPNTRTHEQTHEETSAASQVNPPATHEPTHEDAHEPMGSTEKRLASLEGRILELEAALLHGVQSGQWGGI